jgi:D-amino-acid oxidase
VQQWLSVIRRTWQHSEFKINDTVAPSYKVNTRGSRIYSFESQHRLDSNTDSHHRSPIATSKSNIEFNTNTNLRMSTQDPQHIAILGAGIIGLTSALVLAHAHPSASITITAKHFPGDRSIEYTSPWAGANWSSMANDNGPLENYDRITFQRFGELMDGRSVHGCQVVKSGEGNEAGLGKQQMWAVLDAPIEQTNLLTPQTGKIWYDELVGGLRYLDEKELPEGAVFGLEFPSTFRINTQVYLQW